MDLDDPFSRELRSLRDRIAELRRRSVADPRPGHGLLPEALAELDLALEELSVAGEELRSRNDELASTRQALEAERQRYQELFESAPAAYLVTDPMGRIREANRTAAALLGVGKGFLAGKPLAAYVDGSDRCGFRSVVNRLGQGDQGRVADWPLRLRRRGGEVLTVAATVEPVLDHDGGLATLRWLLRRPEPALEDLDVAADLGGTVQVLVDAGVRLLGVDGIGLMLADTQGRLCAAGGSGAAILAFLRAQEHTVKGPCVHAYLLERTVQARCLDGDGRWPQLADAAAVHAVGAALATPIGLDGGPVGACLLVSAGPRAWTDADQLAAEAYA